MEAKRADMVFMIRKLLNFESTAFTLDERHLSDTKEKFLAQYKAISGKEAQAATPVAVPFTFSPVSL